MEAAAKTAADEDTNGFMAVSSFRGWVGLTTVWGRSNSAQALVSGRGTIAETEPQRITQKRESNVRSRHCAGAASLPRGADAKVGAERTPSFTQPRDARDASVPIP